MTSYAHAEVLVETDWVKANLGKAGSELLGHPHTKGDVACCNPFHRGG